MRSYKQISLLIILSTVIFSFTDVKAAPGDLDPTFNLTGIKITDIGDTADSATGSVIQTDGKLVVVGTSGNRLAVVRYNTDGSPDASFGVNGRVTNPISGGQLFAVALQADGKIVVNTLDATTTANFAVVRFNLDGTLDNSFDGDGTAVISIAGEFAETTSIAVQSDGKIVVAGSADDDSGDSDIVVVRLNSDGSLDTSFDFDGKVSTRIGITSYGNSLAVQSDGKIVIGGYCYISSGQAFALVRFNADGSLDTSFDGDGKLATAILSNGDNINSIKIQSDGKIVAAGLTYNGVNVDFAVVRYNTDGSLDNAFDTDGKVITPVGSLDDLLQSIAVQNDGKIIAVGSSFNGTKNIFAVVRYNTDGSLDTSFDGDGKVFTNIGILNDTGSSANIQSDGKIFAVGTANKNDFGVVRYNTDGSLDSLFDTDGIVVTGEIAGNGSLQSIALQSNGKIVAAGYSSNGNDFDFAVARYNSDGNLDNTFDTDGKVVTQIGFSNDIARSSAIQTDGKIIVAGNTDNGKGSDFAVVRYNTNGSLDASFDTDGIVTTSFGTVSTFVYSVKIQADGKIVVAGSTGDGSTNDFALVRYNPNGSLDTSFDADGKLTTSISAGNDEANSVNCQPDGKIIAAGYSFNSGDSDFAIVRYNADGSFDTSFDTDGIVTTSIGSQDIINSIAVQANGKIIAAGYSTNVNRDITLARYNIDGSLDTTFDSDGIVTTPVGPANSYANSVAIETDGKIVVAGGTDADFAVVKYNINGSLDSAAFAKNSSQAFGTNGIVTTDISGQYDSANSVAVQPDGKIIAGGSAYNTFALVRYQGFVPTAAAVNVSGQITSANGNAIQNVSVRISGGNLQEPKYMRSNSFGYYSFEDLQAGQTYILSVAAKKYIFANPTRLITLNEDLTDANFVGEGK